MAIEPLIPSDPESPPTATSSSQDHPHPLKQHRLYDPPASPPPSSPTSPIPSPPRPESQHSHQASVQFLSGMDPLSPSTSSRGSSSRNRNSKSGLRARLGLSGVARRTLGITLLLFTVCLWTVSNFLASYIFSDNTYSKPFFLVYINTSIFAFSLIPISMRYILQYGLSGALKRLVEAYREGGNSSKLTNEGEDRPEDSERLLIDDEGSGSLEAFGVSPKTEAKLSLRETAKLSLEFCALWFAANYFASACLEYTSVGSVTILTSTSSIWTLIFCAITKVEGFSVRKLIGVLASLAGVVLISSVDLSGAADDNRGNFPHKSVGQIAIGDSMAFFSAIIYGVYVTVMKRRVGNEDRVDMPLFFGLVGLFNLCLFWPGFLVLHWTGIETFQLPPTPKIWTIIIVNSVSSFFSDMFWAYAMLLTTPLVVTVGLSLTIPLSLIGEMIQYAQYSSWVYWVGAGIVFISFVFVNHESKEDEDKEQRGDGL